MRIIATAGTTPVPPTRQNAGVRVSQHEPATDRAPELQDVADLGHLGQELRDLAPGKPLDQELHQRVIVVRGDGVGPLGGVVVGRTKPDQVVLSRRVPLPVLDEHAQPHGLRGRQLLGDDPAGRPRRLDRDDVVDRGLRQRLPLGAAHGSPW